MVARASGGTDVALRTIAATAGSYAIATGSAIVLARTLPIAPVEAVVTATLVALLLVLPVAAMACFWIRSGWWACGGSLAVCVALACLAVASGGPV